MRYRLIFLVVLFGNVAAYASFGSYFAPIKRGNQTSNMLVYNTWSGEYPVPIPVIKAEAGKSTRTLKAYKGLRELTNQFDCTVASGIYHPWANPQPAGFVAYTIVPRVEYVAKEDVLLELWTIHGARTVMIRKNDRFIKEIYFGEGSFQYTLKSNGLEYEVTGGLADNKKFAVQTYPSHTSEEWVSVQCLEGYRGFIHTESLMKQQGVKSGTFSEFGKVSEQ